MRNAFRVRTSMFVAMVLATVAGLLDLRAARRTRDEWNPRVAQRQQLRWLSAHITAYAREYGRPAFYLDSVVAHLDSATAARFNDYRTDLWGDAVYYWWDEQSFTLASRAGIGPDRHWRMADSIRAARAARGDTTPLHPFALARRIDVREEYWWPVEARGRRNSWGQYTRVPGFNEPILVQARPLPRVDERAPRPEA